MATSVQGFIGRSVQIGQRAVAPRVRYSPLLF